MGDVFMEKMVKRKMPQFDYLMIAAVFVLMLIVSGLSLLIGTFMMGFPMLTLLVTAGAIFGVYKFIGSRRIEYEYSLTNGFVAVDRIANRASRKRLTSFECDTCEDIGKYQENEARLKTRSFDLRVFATEFADHRDAWYMIVRSPKTGKTLVVFNPDEELLTAVKRFIPRQLRFEKFGRDG